MASKKLQFSVGLFVAFGLSIAVIALIWLGMSRFFEKGQYYVTYFDESVQGLSQDSPVKYRGVSVGRVASIDVAPDSELIQVILKIETGQELRNDIVAQLKAVGITGSMFVELDRRKKEAEDRSPSITFPAEYPIVASRPSDISELLQGVDDVIQHIKSLDLKGISEKIALTLDTTNIILAETDIKGMTDRFNTVLDQASSSMTRIEKTLGRVEGIVMEKEKTIKASIDEFRVAMEKTNVLLENGAVLVRSVDNTIVRLNPALVSSLQNIERTTQDLSQLLELLSDHPARALFGDPPKPREMD